MKIYVSFMSRGFMSHLCFMYRWFLLCKVFNVLEKYSEVMFHDTED